jgi:hypothetical protein
LLWSQMTSESKLDEARASAKAILALRGEDLSKLFFEQTMRRNLSRTVRHLDRLIKAGGEDRKLGERALSRLGFFAED